LSVTAVFTNNPPATSCHGAGACGAGYIIERAMDLVAAALELDCVEVRRLNLIRELPATTVTRARYDSGDFSRLVDRAVERSQYVVLRQETSSRRRKGELVGSVIVDSSGSPIANDLCPVASAGFNALVAFNALELGTTIGDAVLIEAGEDLAAALSARWDRDVLTWVDDGPTARDSGRARTLDALLGSLVDPVADHVRSALDQLVDPTAHGARFGPTGVHRDEPTFAADVYWRGPAWPQLSYLLWVAARSSGRDDIAHTLGVSLIEAASISGLAEYWHPDTAAPGGAVPQSWTGLALLVTPRGGDDERPSRPPAVA
jgi:hypothetical protein